VFFELIVNYERVRKNIFFTQNRFFKFYDSELSDMDKGKLITHI
jgi:hypothetical protein